jgi:hypothetical protein
VTGPAPQVEWMRAVCLAKRHTARCLAQAANLAYLLAIATHQRVAVYACPQCGLYHASSHKLDGDNAVLCSWPGAR